MLVFISDLHLSDGTTFESIDPEAFRVFAEDLHWMVGQACRHRTPEGHTHVKALQRVDLVLLGDVFDPLRSSAWTDRETNPRQLRPWSPELAGASLASESHNQLGALVETITRRMVAHNDGQGDSRGLGHLRRLARDGIRPKGLPEGTRIPLKIWYLVGNHDWFYYVQHPAYRASRQAIVEALGLAQSPDEPFPHRIEQAPAELREVFNRHEVWAQHGDVYDDDNFQGDAVVAGSIPPLGSGGRALSSLGDLIVIELVNRLPREIIERLSEAGDPLAHDPLFEESLDELDNVRPMQAIPQWLISTLQRFETGDADRNQGRRRLVNRAVRDRLTELEREHGEFLHRVDRWGWDTTDTMRAAKWVSFFTPLKWLAHASEFGRGDSSRIATEFRKEAARHCSAPEGTRREQSRFVVLGHTHRPEVVPLDRKGPVERVYINTGTWRTVHERCFGDSGNIDFLSHHVMSIAAIYVDGERGGRPYETWTGTLGLSRA